MSQNRSTAVMNRRSEPDDSLDDFPTPPWATRALCEHLLGMGFDLGSMIVREPAANRGFMANTLEEYFHIAYASDVHDYGAGFPVRDFLFPGELERVHWTITNPPFRLAEEFIARALETSTIGCAMLLRTAFLEGQDRHEGLFSVTPPARVLQFVERCLMLRGRMIRVGALDPFNLKDGAPVKAATATSYSWLVWIHGDTDTRLRWLASCRRRLERPDDYPNYSEQWAKLEQSVPEAML